MRGDRDAGLDRGRGEPPDRRRDLPAARADTGDEGAERRLVKPGAPEIDADPVGVDLAGDLRGVLVEGEEVDPALGEPSLDLVDHIEIEGLEAQVQPRIAAEMRARGGKRRQKVARCLGAAQSRLPGQGQTVIGGGDAVGEQLPVSLDEGRDGGKMHAGARHELALEGVAVKIDDAGQDEKGFVRRLVDRGHRRDATLTMAISAGRMAPSAKSARPARRASVIADCSRPSKPLRLGARPDRDGTGVSAWWWPGPLVGGARQ